MATTLSKNKSETEAFRLRGSLFTLTVLHLLKGDLKAFQEQLQYTIAQAPKFFDNAPIVIDLNELPQQSESLILAQCCEILRSHGLVPVAVRGTGEHIRKQAMAAGIAILTHSETQKSSQSPKKIPASPKQITEKAEQPKEAPSETRTTTKTRVITQPVRSGQQIYAKGGDLIVLASVSHGAEILADGNIHVYGPLRGRALAGIMGDHEARIFCKSLDAELVSIAGHYLVNEQLGTVKETQNLHIFLENDQLFIKPT